MTTSTLRILSVDGGGVRGIIPARILQEIEKRTNKHTSELFDMSTGTSTGSLVVLGLGAPDKQGAPKNSAQDMVNLYLNDSNKIFNKSLLRNIWTGFGLWGAKYDRKNLDEILGNIFGLSLFESFLRISMCNLNFGIDSLLAVTNSKVFFS